MNYLKITAISLFLTISIIGFGQNKKHTGLLYGEGYSYLLTAPEGWVLDNVSAKEQGLNAVFYPKDNTWDNIDFFIYVEGYTSTQPFDDFISNDLLGWRKKYENLIIEEDTLAGLDINYDVKVEKIHGGNYEYYVYSIYVNFSNSIGTIVLMSNSYEKLEENVGKLVEVANKIKVK